MVYLLSDSSDTEQDTAKKVKKMKKAAALGAKPKKMKETTRGEKKKGEGGVRRARIINTDKSKRGPKLEPPSTPRVGPIPGKQS